jgi:dTDP-4-amino-4,6-dideoxygalactose transaminase
MITVAEPSLGDDEKQALAQVIDDGWITMGPRVDAFERQFAALHGARDAVAVSSCTAGLHLALAALGVGPGDEVLLPAMTFVATANSVLYVGARPVFVDIESADRPLMALSDARAKWTPRTRAIVLVHYAGQLPRDVAEWRNFAAERDILVIEDAAHAVGIPEVGHIGDAAAFSFYGNKNLTTAEGGAVITRSEEAEARIRQLRGHGLTSATFQRHGSAVRTYDVPMLGFNYRMDELRAAIGLVQLRRLAEWNRIRRDLVALYRDRLGRLPELTVPFRHDERSSWHIMPVCLPVGIDRQAVIASMLGAGVQTSVHYPPVHQLTLYRERAPGTHLPVTEDYGRRELTLPLHPQLTPADVDTVADALAAALEAQQPRLDRAG